MTILRNRYGFDGELSFECDECGRELHTGEDNFPAALRVMKENGWKNVWVQENDRWNHYCSKECHAR